MASTYITTATTTQCETGAVPKILVTVNTALTGTITLIDGTSGTTANKGILTNPGVGVYEYWDFANGVRVVTSATCDITVNTSSTRGPK
jgi:hypothetical protein